MFITELTVKNEDFFTQRMLVFGEVTLRQITNDGGRARHLITRAIQHATLDAGNRAGDPA